MGRKSAFVVITGPRVVLPGLNPMSAKIASRIERHRSLIVMVRLDRTIGVPKIALSRCVRADGPVEPDHDEGWEVRPRSRIVR